MKKKTFNLKQLKGYYDNGYESYIVNYPDENNENQLLKMYKERSYMDIYGKYHIDEPLENIRKRKEEKLILLSEINDDSIVKINDLIYDNGELIGYTMNKINGKKIRDIYPNNKEKIEYLKQIKDTMIRLNEKGIYIGDFNPNNFLIDENGKVINIDIDNYKIKDYDFDTKSIYMRNYERSTGKKELIDRYCFNILAIATLGNYAFGYLDIHNCKLPHKYNTKENIDIIYDMIHVNQFYDGKILTLEKKKN